MTIPSATNAHAAGHAGAAVRAADAATRVDHALAIAPSDHGDPNGLTLLPAAAVERLLDNGRRIARTGDDDLEPAVKLFTPDANCTWLLVSIDPDAPDVAYGLCDLGLGCPEVGSVSIAELRTVRGAVGLPVERDVHFVPEGTLGFYAEKARRFGTIHA